ncbi:K(+)-transporting ATPase subunit C [Salmonirosea aquatica]|uniref:Potassium-transporting ATPase KdpC subunit n=1 Tax=Salmonirosea aquatica TaxID=2654236 RepID=A0A7C9FE49_9BACT|nr:K(+)-transporting ATPase subunit C [Cytophagaceae bacterium SJW1-29]
MKTNLIPALRLTLVCVVLFMGLYPALIWGIAQLAPNKGKGEVVAHNGATYFTQIGQNFTTDRYFNSRPSAVNYNAAGSGGSNKGPSNPEYLATVAARVDTFRAHNPGMEKVPAELVTASGSGLDPDLSVEAVLVQIPRIARARSVSEESLRQLAAAHTEQPLLGLFGPEKVNVLALNLALDNLAQ